MIGGYVRLSRDEDGRNYSSIENQIELIKGAAKENGHVIDKWYIDDNISGYIFDRPSFNELNKDLQDSLDVVYVKDFSRIGRHNAKVLLFIEQFPVIRKRLIVVNEDYDSDSPVDDDIIGIKTWYNERYVKDTSKKIKKVISYKQKNNLLPYSKHFGYEFADKSRKKIVVVSQEEKIILLIKNLYISGMGYRSISQYLNDRNIKTPSQLMHERDVQNGELHPTRILATKWSSGMIKEILDDDFYIGIRRTHVREKKTIHGMNLRVPKDNQYVFENDHPAIFDKKDFDLICQLREERYIGDYKGRKKRDMYINVFSGLIYCKNCGHLYTPIVMKRKNGFKISFACSLYNRQGRKFCDSHLISEEKLLEHVYIVFQSISDCLCKYLENFNMIDIKKESKNIKNDKFMLQSQLNDYNAKLQELISQKLMDLSCVSNEYSKNVISKSYDQLQKNILDQIESLNDRLLEYNKLADNINENSVDVLQNAKNYIDDLLNKGQLELSDIARLIKRIEIDNNNNITIKLRYDLGEEYYRQFEKNLNRRNNEIIMGALLLLKEKSFLSIKSLSDFLDKKGIHCKKTEVKNILNMFEHLGYIYKTDIYHKPYCIKKSFKIDEIIDEISRAGSSDQDVSYNGFVSIYSWSNHYIKKIH